MNAPASHRRLVTRMLLVAGGMFGFGFALVPLYDALCRLTGLNGRGSGTAVPGGSVWKPDLQRTVWLELLATRNTREPWTFAPAVERLAVHPGAFYSTHFLAHNPVAAPRQVQAVANVTPGLAAPYLHKTDCFCFRRQVFAPHETREMGVRFVLDPGLPAEVQTLSLAYSLFDVPGGA
jgi:cytochrome c oxidase assembly protein subunit 11